MGRAVEIEGVEALVKKMKRLKGRIIEGRIPFLLAGDLRAMIEQRIKKGQGLRGGFADYSTTPYYRSAKELPKGKGGRRVSKTGKKMKSIFYEGGYKQFAALTKGSSTPDLIASGEMLRAFQPQVVDKNTARLMFTRQSQALKAAYANARRPFIGATRRMRARLNRRFDGILDRLMRELKLT